jgi:hypothetical protein
MGLAQGVVLGVLVLVPTRAQACKCVVEANIERAAARADVVFRGRVLDVAEAMGPVAQQPERMTAYRQVRVERLASYQGTVPEAVTLRTGLGDGDCGFPFRVGEEYLVFAERHPGAELSTDICTRTARIQDAEEDLAYFGDPQAPLRGWRRIGFIGIAGVILGGLLMAFRRARRRRASPRQAQ